MFIWTGALRTLGVAGAKAAAKAYTQSRNHQQFYSSRLLITLTANTASRATRNISSSQLASVRSPDARILKIASTAPGDRLGLGLGLGLSTLPGTHAGRRVVDCRSEIRIHSLVRRGVWRSRCVERHDDCAGQRILREAPDSGLEDVGMRAAASRRSKLSFRGPIELVHLSRVELKFLVGGRIH